MILILKTTRLFNISFFKKNKSNNKIDKFSNSGNSIKVAKNSGKSKDQKIFKSEKKLLKLYKVINL